MYTMVPLLLLMVVSIIAGPHKHMALPIMVHISQQHLGAAITQYQARPGSWQAQGGECVAKKTLDAQRFTK